MPTGTTIEPPSSTERVQDDPNRLSRKDYKVMATLFLIVAGTTICLLALKYFLSLVPH